MIYCYEIGDLFLVLIKKKYYEDLYEMELKKR